MSRGFAVIALDHPKNVLNVGSVLRIAHNYRASLVVTSGLRYRHASTDTPKGRRHIPLLENLDDVFDAIPYDTVPVAVDIIEDACSLPEYKHPRRAFYVFGQEDGTLGERILSRCRDVVYVPTQQCMNLAVTVGVVMYDRMVKGA